MNKKTEKAAVIAAIAVLLLALWLVWGNRSVTTTNAVVSSERLPKAFDGFRIAHVSDLHNDSAVSYRLHEKVQAVNPDIIAVTGDLIDCKKTDIKTAVECVERLAEIAPVYYVTGNHEGNVDDSAYTVLENSIKACGAAVLHDESVTIERDGEHIAVVGLDDAAFPNKNRISFSEKHIRSVCPSGEYCVLLAHRPECFDMYVRAGADTVLSGHAHGGQLRIPFIGGVIAPGQGLFPRYTEGVYTSGETSMVVSRGLGNSIIPIRVNNRPELVCVELRCE